MIIGKTKFIEELYNGYIVSEYDKKYRFKLYDNRIGNEINTKHLIIKNYQRDQNAKENDKTKGDKQGYKIYDMIKYMI